ncbi:MAG: homocysteine S-methyltransferase family protein [Clostridium sp.]|jgi:5-methyltetrahydrofolate--homocysteine methyltransferase|nr:homocysteine S-methyltransferase family protein [Clostridium sp.]
MTREEFQQFVSQRIVYLDGATGTNLSLAGMPAGACPEQWILEHREVMVSLQRAYVRAGSDILYTPTFSGNRVKFKEYGLEERIESMTADLVGISREAVRLETRPGNEGPEETSSARRSFTEGSSRRVYLAGDLTMTGELLFPMGRMKLEELVAVYQEQIAALVKAGVDLLVVETMMSLREARAALLAAKEVCGLPVMVTMTFEKNGHTLYGTDAATAAAVLESLGAAAVGANCSQGPGGMREIIRAMAGATRIPIIAKPNAGLPSVSSNGVTAYDMDAAVFAEEMRQLVEAGALILGGCCGTTPEYIRLLKEKTREAHHGQEVGRRPEGLRYLASERRVLPFTLDQNFMIVGERINPTGKKKLQAQLREGNLELVRRFAEEQEACGAVVLDVNMGMSGIDEKELLLRAVEEIGGVSSLPLALDSSHIEVLEAALRQYPGRALVNSVSLEREKFEKLLPVVAKYGAMFILLPLSDRGLPETQEEKKQMIHTVMERAMELGISKEDMVVDGLVTTVGANPGAALEALETIRYCKELGLATICGLSNISFGMPERDFVNAAFLALAIREGLTMAIANPSQGLLTGCAAAADLLLRKEKADLRYIECAASLKSRRETLRDRRPEAGGKPPGADGLPEAGGKPPGPDRPTVPAGLSAQNREPEPTDGIRERLRNALLKGDRGGIGALTESALAQGQDASVLLNQVLLPAIREVGDGFETGRYFLPQLIASAEAMKLSIEILEPRLRADSRGDKLPTVVIATVAGDIHDIGKNLVALMLKNHGFQVVDLGKDVSKEAILAAAEEHQARFIALSALMTTTMRRMKEVVEYVRGSGVEAKIIIGGAVVTQEYAREIGADGYSKDAAGAVKLVQQLQSGA